MTYKIGYKLGERWRYIIIEGNLQVVMNTVESLLSMGHTNVSIKSIESIKLLKPEV